MNHRMRLLALLSTVGLGLCGLASKREAIAQPVFIQQSNGNDTNSGVARQIVPLIRAHAHNDYEHTRPLLDALDNGFCSVEADIWLVDGQLLVAHNLEDTKADRTLQALYLDPLKHRIKLNGGSVYSNGVPCTLMIDVKSAAEPTYAALRAVLEQYTDIVTTFTETNTVTNALTIVLSGNEAIETISNEKVRLLGLDGRLKDLDKNVSPQLYPLISDNWKLHFKWRGQGEFPETERQKLEQFVDRAHALGCRIRFWATPDTVAAWRELRSAGVDLINTDNLAGLATFLKDSTR